MDFERHVKAIGNQAVKLGKHMCNTLKNSSAKATKENDRALIGPGVWAWGLTNRDGCPHVASPNEKHAAHAVQMNKL
eukprot:3051374-Lingulodinium_polyedra.AAC.1